MFDRNVLQNVNFFEKNVTDIRKRNGDVIGTKPLAEGYYANRYTGIPQRSPVLQSIGIPVDNS